MDLEGVPPLPSLRAFHYAALTLSFRRAADMMRITPSAVSHQIRSLELQLGVPLFRRLTRAIELTPEGELYWSHVRRAFDILKIGTAQLREQSRDEVLRVSALPFFTSVCLIPRLSHFHTAHPDIELVIETSNHLSDFTREPVDIAIRNLRKPETGLTSKKLLDVRGEVLCAPQLAPSLKTPADLSQHTLIHILPRPDSWAHWLRSVGEPELKPASELWVDTIPAALQAASEGHGVTLGMVPLIWATDLTMRLVRPFDKRVPGNSAYYLVHRPEDAAKPKIRAFAKWIAKEMITLSKKRGPNT